MKRQFLLALFSTLLLFPACSPAYGGVHQADSRIEETQNSTIRGKPTIFSSERAPQVKSQTNLVINGNWDITTDTTYDNYIITLNNGNLTIEAEKRLILLNSELRFNFTSGNVTRGIKLANYGSRITFYNSKLYSISNQRLFFYHVAESTEGKRDLVNITRSTIEDIGVSYHSDDRLSGLHVRYGGLIFVNSIMQSSGDGLDVDQGWGSYANTIQNSIIKNVEGRGVDLRHGVCSNTIVKNITVYNSTRDAFDLNGEDYIVDSCLAKPAWNLSLTSEFQRYGFRVYGTNITVQNSRAFYTDCAFSAGATSENVKFINDSAEHSWYDLFNTDGTGNYTIFKNIYGYHGGFGLGIGRNTTNVYIENAYLERVGKINDGTAIGSVIGTPQSGFGLFENVDNIYVSNMTVVDAGRAIRVQEAMGGWGNTHDNITICNSNFQGDIYFDNDQESWDFKLINTTFGTVIYESGTKGNMTALFTFQGTNMNMSLFFSATQNNGTSITTMPTYSNNKLSFTVSAPSGATSIAEVYVGDKGEPTAVPANNGTLTWNYNASTKILTLNVVHNGPANILVDWRILGDVNGDNKVDASDLFDLGKAYGSDASKPNWNQDCDFNWDSKIDSLDLLTLSKNYGRTNP